MKISYAALFSGLAFLAAALFAAFVARSGWRITGVQLPRQAWLLDNSPMWELGLWLWLVAIFSWMLLLITFMWRYTPAHRVSTMLQSGLMLIAATLAIAGIVIWMGALPRVAAHDDIRATMVLVDGLALSLLGAGCFMGGLVTAWIGIDLVALQKLTWSWTLPGVAAGLLAIPAPFVLPTPHLLIASGLSWLLWCIFLSTRRDEPKPFAEWL